MTWKITDKALALLIFFNVTLRKIQCLISFIDSKQKPTLSPLSSENVSTMIPNTMFSPIVMTIMKNERSKIKRGI